MSPIPSLTFADRLFLRSSLSRIARYAVLLPAPILYLPTAHHRTPRYLTTGISLPDIVRPGPPYAMPLPDIA
eukprot:3493127-Rhodomonas_salina.1